MVVCSRRVVVVVVVVVVSVVAYVRAPIKSDCAQVCTSERIQIYIQVKTKLKVTHAHWRGPKLCNGLEPDTSRLAVPTGGWGSVLN